MATIKLRIGAEEMACLMRGGELTMWGKGDTRVKLLMPDIGFDVLQEKLDRAKAGVDKYESHESDG